MKVVRPESSPGQSGPLVAAQPFFARLRVVGKTVELRGHPESSSYQAGAERQPVAGVMT
jgi:hypothetical protein